MRRTSLDLRCLNQKGSKSYMVISNLFDRKKSINHNALVPSYFVVFFCPEVHHLTFWPFPRWHLSSVCHLLLPHWTVKLLLHLLSTHWDSSQHSCQGGAWAFCGPPGFVSPHFTPIVSSFTFQFLHRWNCAVKFTSCSIFPFIESNLLCWVFLSLC